MSINQPTLPSVLYAILMAFSIAAGTALAGLFQQNILLGFGVGTVLAMVVLTVGIVQKVWAEVEPMVVQSAVLGLQTRLSRTEKRYRHFISDYCTPLDIRTQKVSSVGLDVTDVFVELGISQEVQHDYQAIISDLPSKDRYEIWEFLRTRENLAILGPAGSGKTTMLKHIAVKLAGRGMGKAFRTRLPAVIELRMYATRFESDVSAWSLVDLVSDQVKHLDVPPQWVKDQLVDGRFILLFDGLDEVADEIIRRRLVAWLLEQTRWWGKNQFVVTSRPSGYTALDGFMELQVLPFNQHQVRQFVHQWYCAHEEKHYGKSSEVLRQQATEGAKRLFGEIYHSPLLAALAQNPLLLTLMAKVHFEGQQLPRSRVELYQEIFRLFLHQRDYARAISRTSGKDRGEAIRFPHKMKLLQKLAYHMQSENLRSITMPIAAHLIQADLNAIQDGVEAADFLHMIADSSGLFVEDEAWHFAHLTLQEYLAATHIKTTPALEKTLLQQVKNAWWRETLLFYAAQTNATALVNACLDHQPSVDSLSLAAEVVEVALEVDKAAAHRVEQIMAANIDPREVAQWRLAAKVKLQLRLRQLMRLSEKAEIDTSLITQVEYQLFLEGSPAYAPEHWEKRRIFTCEESRQPIAGISQAAAQAFCDWLTHRDTAWRYRLPTDEEAQQVAVEKTGVVGYWSETRYWQGDAPLVNVVSAVLRQLEQDVQGFKSNQQFINLNYERESFIVETVVRQQTEPHYSNVDGVYAEFRRRAESLAEEVAALPFELPLARDLKTAYQRDWLREPTIAIDLAGELAKAVTGDLPNSYTKMPTLSTDPLRGLGFQLYLTHELAYRLSKTRHLQEAIKLAYDLVRAVASARALANALALSRDSTEYQIFLKLSLAFRWVQFLYVQLSFADTGELGMRRLRDRFATLNLMSLFANYERILVEEAALFSKLKTRRELIEKVQTLTETLGRLYLELAVVEQRVKHHLPPLEGIRIARER